MFRVLPGIPLLVTLVMLISSGGCESTQPAADAQVSTPLAEGEWKVVGTWSGRGNGQLETFPIERFTWRVRWKTTNESSPGAGTLHVTAHSADSGRLLAEVVDVRGVGEDVEYITELPHRYYLVVMSENVDWTLTAEEAVIK